MYLHLIKLGLAIALILNGVAATSFAKTEQPIYPALYNATQQWAQGLNTFSSSVAHNQQRAFYAQKDLADTLVADVTGTQNGLLVWNNAIENFAIRSNLEQNSKAFTTRFVITSDVTDGFNGRPERKQLSVSHKWHYEDGWKITEQTVF